MKDCAYKRNIPGNCHIKCVFDWSNTKFSMPESSSDYGCQWFNFPYNYDITWGPDKCPVKVKKLNEKMVREESSLMKIASLIG